MASETPPSPPSKPVEGITSLPPTDAAVGGPAGAPVAAGPKTGLPPGISAQDAPPSSSAQAGPSQIKVFAPPTSSSLTPIDDLPDTYFQPTASDLAAAQSSLARRAQNLNDRPLALARTRDEEKARREREKAEKWPRTVIRVRFSDRTQVEGSFESGSTMKPVYEFVRSCLADEIRSKPFILYQPPNRQYPEVQPPPPPVPAHKRRLNQPLPPIKEPTLSDLQLVPQSVLLIRFQEDALNATDRPAPLQLALLAKSAPLPTTTEPQAPPPPTKQELPSADTGKRKDAPSGEKKMPKWLQKGLLKK